jgi:hypothetical protein
VRRRDASVGDRLSRVGRGGASWGGGGGGGAAIEPKYSSACRPNSGASREQCRRRGGEGETVLRLAGSTWVCINEKKVGGDQVRMYAVIIWVTAAAGSCRTYVGIIAPIRLRASV